MVTDINNVTAEELQKALQILGIETDDISKGTDGAGKNGSQKGSDKPVVGDVEQNHENFPEGKNPVDTKKEDDGFKKAMKEYKDFKKSIKQELRAKKDEIKKSFPNDWEDRKLKKSAKKELMKDMSHEPDGDEETGNPGKNTGHSEPDGDERRINKRKIQKSQGDSLNDGAELIEGLTEKFEAQSTLIKAIMNDNVELRKQIEVIGNSPVGRKSIGRTNVIEKAFTQDKDSGKKVLSISQHKKEVADTLMSYADQEINKGETNGLYCNAALLYDASKTLRPNVIADLFNKGIKLVQ